MKTCLLLSLGFVSLFALPLAAGDADALRREARGLASDGLYAKAWDLYRKIILDKGNAGFDVVRDVEEAMELVGHAVDASQAEELLEAVFAQRMDSILAQAAAARALAFDLPKDGRIVDGEFQRDMDGIGQYADVWRRDRARAMAAMAAAEPNVASAEVSDSGKAFFYETFADIVMYSRRGQSGWLFTSLTRLDPLPDYDADANQFWRGFSGAPVDDKGDPLFYDVPSSWDTAANDGQRWRWLLAELSKYGGKADREAAWRLASFLRDQFGVNTVAHGPFHASKSSESAEDDPFAVRSLSENETIARLATGVRRFKLPDAQNYIALFRNLAAQKGAHRNDAARELARIFEDRQQYPKAAGFWRRLVDENNDEEAKEALEKITGNVGNLEAASHVPAGKKAKLPFVFRNGDSVNLTVQKLDEKLFLNDIRNVLKSGDIDDSTILSPEAAGIAVVEKNRKKYIQELTAEWTMRLDPLPDHFSRRIFIEMPFEQAGAYLVTAKMQNGNTSRAVFWQSDLALVGKTVGGTQLYFVADAVTGEPVPQATLSFFGYNIDYSNESARNRPRIGTSEFAESTDGDGLLLLPAERFKDMSWLATADTTDKRFAYMGFSRVWAPHIEYRPERVPAVYVLTDRPVYRPNDDIGFKIWVGKRSHALEDNSLPAGTPVDIVIHNPMGQVVYEKTLASDRHGGVDDRLVLDGEAALGMYQISARSADGNGQVAFRLEEYKTPEFEVSVDSKDAVVTLGDTFTAKITAKYYFGAPVSNAKVKYRVTRSGHSFTPFPPMPWDWLYGRDYGRIAYDYSWLPGWNEWGSAHIAPAPWAHSPSELVLDSEGELDADGELTIAIDTADAKQIYGNQDHRYEIAVEIMDSGRRTIVGNGSVIAARKPFSVSVWLDRGFYFAGEGATATVQARTPTGKGVQTKGDMTLYRIGYDAKGNATEEKVDSWPISTDADGNAHLKIVAAEPGQYRLGCVLSNADSGGIEGGAVLTVRGDAAPGGDFRYASLELVPDKREYQPGDNLKLAVNSQNKKAVVLLFPKVESDAGKNPEAARPLVLRLEEGSTLYTTPIALADQPNFFCEALTVFNGRLYSEAREIFVPPSGSIVNVEVVPDSTRHLPGGKAEFTVKVTDDRGKPVQGQLVAAVYDKAVEYVSGGSNIDDIRSAFWSWKRYYRAKQQASLNRRGRTIALPNDVSWQPIGVFGWQEMDWNREAIEEEGSAGDDDGSLLYGASLIRSNRGDGAMMAMPEMAMAMDTSMPTAAKPAPAFAARKQDAPATGGGMAEPQVRSEFAGTALWLASLDLDSTGMATFSADLPDNLTTWKTRVWAKTPNTRVGEASVETVAAKNVLIRPQTPRFLTQKDQVVLSANLHNYLPRGKKAEVEITLEGAVLELADGVQGKVALDLAANSEARVDWLAKSVRSGEAVIRMRLLTDEESDAAEVKLPVLIHGARRVESYGTVMRPGTDIAAFAFTVPQERLADRSALAFSFSPTIASTLLDALPYLIEYPYGCTEQTLNRFLPAAMTKRYLETLGLSLADATAKQSGGRFEGPADKTDPVFDDKALATIVKQGVDRLLTMQNADGGWGWFSGTGERSWGHTTAIVMHGLLAARELGIAIPPHVLENGVAWLRLHQDNQIAKLKQSLETNGKEGKKTADNLDSLVYMVLAGQGSFNPDMRDFLYRDRLELSLSGLSMLGIALHSEKATNALSMVLANLEQYVQHNKENGTAWLKLPRGGWWWWYNDEIETMAWYLKLLCKTDPRGDNTTAIAKYLLENRKNAAYWRSTRDTAYALESLIDYAVASGETDPKQTVRLYYDDVLVMERGIDKSNIFEERIFRLDGLAVEEGKHEIRIERSGAGNLYVSGRLDLFSLEDPIATAGGDLKVARAFYKLEPEDAAAASTDSGGRAVDIAVEKYRRIALPTPFAEGATVPLAPGDLVEVELSIETANDYEYLVFEDMKAAGLEAVELRSGYSGNSLGAYVEYRDQKVVLFVRSLPRGKYNLSYRFRAETPGWFSALPATGGGMYATDLVANSDEMKVRVSEPGTFE